MIGASAADAVAADCVAANAGSTASINNTQIAFDPIISVLLPSARKKNGRYPEKCMNCASGRRAPDAATQRTFAGAALPGVCTAMGATARIARKPTINPEGLRHDPDNGHLRLE